MDAEIGVRILERALAVGPRCGRATLIAIDGRSGSGKTTLAMAIVALAESRGLTCAVVHGDELCPGWDGLPAVPGRFSAIVEGLRARGRATYPTWDWHANGPGAPAELPPTNLVIFEGPSAADPQWAASTSASVWMEAPVRRRKQRALTRDGETFAPYWDHWAAAEDAYFSGRKPEHADFVVTT
ncbi:MAG: hypothetical protein ACTHOG_12370 [Marmoricola sp.]